MITVAGSEYALPVKEVLWCLDELGLPFACREDAAEAASAVFVAGSAGPMAPDFITHDGTVLSGWAAIMDHLAHRYGCAGLDVSTMSEHEEINRWLAWSISVLRPDIDTVIEQWVRVTAAQRDHRRLGGASARLAENWHTVDRLLAQRPYVAGNRFTIADIALGVSAYAWIAVELEGRPSLLNFNAWYDRIAARPGFQKYGAGPLRPGEFRIF
jgi:glutathione S-transferase